jgi:hypothetical protein
MPFPIKDPFAELLSDLPKGDGWWNVAWTKRLLQILVKDRARAGDNLEEIPTATGRTFKAGKGNAGGAYQPFQIVGADTDGANKVRVLTSTVFGELPDGFSAGDTPPYVLSVSDGDIIYAVLTYSSSDGSISSATLGVGSEVPDDEDGVLNVRIGSVAVLDGKTTPANDCYGPILGTICPYFDLEAGTSKYLAAVTG